MHTMHALDFVSIKRALAEFPDRGPLKRSKDRLQADIVEELVREYMPHHQRANSAATEDDEDAAPRPS